MRRAQSAETDQIPAEEAYKAAVVDMAATLEGTNIEAARAALRLSLGSIPVFMQEGKLYGRMRLDRAALFRARNPEKFGSMVAGGRFELYSVYALRIPAVSASVGATK